MPRVASLYLPHFATDRLRRDMAAKPPEAAGSWWEGGRLPSAEEGQKGERMACSCPREGGWRPGARWAREGPDARRAREGPDARRAREGPDARRAREGIEALPLHRRPAQHEFGRRDEVAATPFRQRRSNHDALCVPAKHREAEPLVTTERIGRRVVIAAADPAARALGLEPGLALAHARAIVPRLDAREADPAGEEAELARLAVFAAKRWTPFAAVAARDGLWLDLTGVAHLFGGEERMARRILAFCARLGFAARIAVAGTWGAAHALARHGSAALTLCPPGGEAEAIAPLPIAALRLADEMPERAARLGLATAGALLAMPRGPLARRFGSDTLDRLDQAIGRRAEPIAPIVPPSAARVELRFAEPIVTAEAIAAAIDALAANLVAALSTRGEGARLVRLACRRVDGGDQYAVATVVRPTRDAAHLAKLLAMKIETIDPGFGIEAMSLVALRADRLGPISIDIAIEGAMAGGRPAPDLSQLVDRLAGRLGWRALWRPGAVESDVPERSVRRLAPLSPATGWRRDWPRPARLLDPPERVFDVLALLPDSPPRRFTWRGAAHKVTRGDGPERIHGEWWRRSGEADAVRDYFRVEDETGARFWLFRRGDGLDARTGDLSWFMQGLFG